MDEHTFVVPAYGQSTHLERCLQSLRAQTSPSPIVISTSTPYDGLKDLARRFQARLAVHEPSNGIGKDWNNAIQSAASKWLTLAHQDDIYLPHFAEATKHAINSTSDALMVFTGYREYMNEKSLASGPLLCMKRVLQEVAFVGRSSIRTRWAKRRLLAFGCPVPCPSVTIRLLPSFTFSEELNVNLDWDAWLRLADLHGAFARVGQTCMLHRIHAGSETFNGTQSGIRQREDLILFLQLWPEWIARPLALLYSASYRRKIS